MTPTTAVCPLLELPPELRDLIYDLLIEDETRPVLRVEIEQDAITQQKHPRISAFTTGLSGTCTQLRNEFSKALKIYIELLMKRVHSSTKYPRLLLTMALHAFALRTDLFHPTDCWIHMSSASRLPHTIPERKFHALATFIPIEWYSTAIDDHVTMLGSREPTTELRDMGYLVVLFVTNKSKALPDHRSLIVPRQPSGGSGVPPPPLLHGSFSALREVKQAVNGTIWKDNLRYYMLWINYVVRFSPGGAVI